MKVLLIDVNCKSGSTGKIAYDIYSYINETGEAAVCYGRGESVNESNIYKFGFDFETKLHALLTRFTGYTGCFSPLSTRRLIRYIKQFKPDVVHIHELHAYFVNIKPLLCFLKKEHIPTVHTLHCEFSYTGKCGHSVDCEQWKTECRNCPRLQEYVKTLWFDRVNYLFHQKKDAFSSFEKMVITAPSAWLTERAKESFLHDYPILTIHNGINTDVFKPCNSSSLRKRLGISEDKKIVLALAPNLMSIGKGGNFVLALSEHPLCKEMFFIMVGVDEKTESSSVNVLIEGRIYDSALLATYYSMADAFLICSQRENFPTTCLEAQCCGTPVYGFNTGGTLETSLAGKSHFVDYGDIDNLASLLCSAPKKTAQDANILAERAKEEFGRETMCRNYAAIYESLIRKNENEKG